MLVSKIKFMIVTFVMMLTLSFIMGNPLKAGIITFIAVMSGYVAIGYRRSRKRLALLEDNCDPEDFLEATEMQRKITGKNLKIGAYLNIDRAAGLILSGEFLDANILLLSIDKKLLSRKNGVLLTYVINLISSYYELGKIEEGEKLFETEIAVLAPINPKLSQAVEFLIAERYFYLERFSESKEKFELLLNDKISNRQRMYTLYRLAQIHEIEGNKEYAEELYNTVAENGNKLWVAVKAREYLKL